jgi:hypothetical protein
MSFGWTKKQSFLIYLKFIYVSQVFLLLQPLLKDFLVFVVSYVSKEQETVQMIY